MDSNNNISISFNEKEDVSNNVDNDYINNMLKEFTEQEEEEEEEEEYNNQKLNKWTSPSIMLNDYTKPQLLKICNYYGIESYVKEYKLKKQDIINTIVYFESLPKNNCIVQKRYLMWENIYELLNDPKMKKYIIWI
jgi:hypothetical protein